MCLAQGPQGSEAGEARIRAPRSRVKHSTTEPLRSLFQDTCSYSDTMEWCLLPPLVQALISKIKDVQDFMNFDNAYHDDSAQSDLHFSWLSFILFDLILYVPSTIFQINRDGSSWVEPVLS